MTTSIKLPEMDEEIIESIFDAADFGDGETIEAIVKEYAEKTVLLNLGRKMTDRELLELAAKAAGIEVTWCIWLSSYEWLTETNSGYLRPWNPINDDGDALRLAVNLRLTVKIEDHEIEIFNWEECLVSFGMFNDGDYEAATRRAIVRAAAEIGRSME